MMSKETILVVDDDWMNRELMEAVFANAGYQVYLANSVESGYKTALEHRPALALIDVRLHGSSSGYDLCRQLKADHSTHHIRVIMVTALETEDAEADAKAAGADGFLNRFNDISVIVQRVADLLAR